MQVFPSTPPLSSREFNSDPEIELISPEWHRYILEGFFIDREKDKSTFQIDPDPSWINPCLATCAIFILLSIFDFYS